MKPSLLYLLVFLPMALAPVSYLIGRRSKGLRDVFAVCVGGLELILALAAFCLRPIQAELPGLCARGLLLELDGFRAVYGGIIGLMWFATLLFSPEYNAHHRNRNRSEEHTSRRALPRHEADGSADPRRHHGRVSCGGSLHRLRLF